MSIKIFITGATGFIGSHLAELCVEKGFEVVAFDRYNPNNNWGWLEGSKYKKDIKIILYLEIFMIILNYTTIIMNILYMTILQHLKIHLGELEEKVIVKINPNLKL